MILYDIFTSVKKVETQRGIMHARNVRVRLNALTTHISLKYQCITQ